MEQLDNVVESSLKHLWLNSVDSKTRSQYRTYINKYEGWSKSSHKVLVENAKKDPVWLAMHLDSYRDSLKKDKLAPNTITYQMHVVRSFYKFCGITLPRASRQDRTSGATYETHEAYPLEAARKMYAQARTSLERGVMQVLAAAQRCEVLTALRVYMLSEDRRIVHIPPRLLDDKGINCNKASVPYSFPLTSSASADLLQHLEERRRAGDPVGSNSLLLTTHRGPLSVIQIETIFYRLADAAGVQKCVILPKCTKKMIHPHGMRKSFKSWVRAASRKTGSGQASDLLLDYVIGHRMKYGGAYDAFEDSQLLEFITEIEPHISLGMTAAPIPTIATPVKQGTRVFGEQEFLQLLALNELRIARLERSIELLNGTKQTVI